MFARPYLMRQAGFGLLMMMTEMAIEMIEMMRGACMGSSVGAAMALSDRQSGGDDDDGEGNENDSDEGSSAEVEMAL